MNVSGKQSGILLAELSIRSSLRALEGYQAPPDFLSGFQTVDKKRSGKYCLTRTTFSLPFPPSLCPILSISFFIPSIILSHNASSLRVTHSQSVYTHTHRHHKNNYTNIITSLFTFIYLSSPFFTSNKSLLSPHSLLFFLFRICQSNAIRARASTNVLYKAVRYVTLLHNHVVFLFFAFLCLCYSPYLRILFFLLIFLSTLFLF